MFKDKLTSKNLGILMLIVSLLILITEFIFVFTSTLYIFVLFNDNQLNLQSSLYAIIPFAIYIALKIILPILAILLSLKYLKNKPLKNNKKIGLIITIAASVYLILQIIMIITSSVGIVFFISSVLWSVYFIALGAGLKELNKPIIPDGLKQ